jgi:hypothetical protein
MHAVRFLRQAALVLAAGIAVSPLYAAPAAIHLFHAHPDGYAFEGAMPAPAGTYFALHCTAGCELRKNRVTVKKRIVDAHDGPVPGVLARAGKAPPSLFMVRGVPGLKEGPVPTWYYNKGFQSGVSSSEEEWKSSQVRRFDIGGQALTIAGIYAQTKDAQCAARADCRGTVRVEWKFRYGEIERTLAVVNGTVPELGTPLSIDDFIVWIGDLDGDGKPDLVVRPQERADYLEMQLFLSRELVPGKPWRRSARFYYWDPGNPGC